MADIAMCSDEQCPIRAYCYRYLAIPNRFSQAYAMFSSRKFPLTELLEEGCDGFWSASTRKDLSLMKLLLEGDWRKRRKK